MKSSNVQKFKITKEMIDKRRINSIRCEIRMRHSEIRTVAKIYARLGLSVIPMRPFKKISYIKWKPNQTVRFTPEEIDKLWDKFPDAQIGIVTGAVSNLAVVENY